MVCESLSPFVRCHVFSCTFDLTVTVIPYDSLFGVRKATSGNFQSSPQVLVVPQSSGVRYIVESPHVVQGAVKLGCSDCHAFKWYLQVAILCEPILQKKKIHQ